MRTRSIAPVALLAAIAPGVALAQSAPTPQNSAGPQMVSYQPAAGPPANPARDQALQNAIPLTPEEITDLANRYRAVQGATENAGQVYATPSNRPAIFTSFAPGQQSNIIQTVKGYPTAISFFDNTGAPWPIEIGRAHV